MIKKLKNMRLPGSFLRRTVLKTHLEGLHKRKKKWLPLPLKW